MITLGTIRRATVLDNMTTGDEMDLIKLDNELAALHHAAARGVAVADKLAAARAERRAIVSRYR